MGYLPSLSESSLLIPVKTDVQDSFRNNVAIKRRIGLFSASTFVVGAIVGSGIFVSPIGVLRFTGSVGGALSVWIGTGILSTVGALCYVELGTTFQQSGSDYTYMRLCFGDMFAFLYLWVYMLIIGPAGNAIAALTFANYVLEPFFPYCIIPQDAIRIIAVLIICVLPKGTDSKEVSPKASGWQRRISLLSTSSFISFVLKAIIGSKSTVLKEPSSLESSDGKKRVGLFSAVTFTLGTVIGCGIFITPAGILRYSGSLGGAMIIWCCSGLISMIGAFVYIELGTTFPQSGRDFIYIQKSFGDLPAFLYIWTSMIVTTPAGMAVQSLTFANYVLEPFFLHCMIPPNAIRMVAGSVICLLTYINCRNVTWATRVQDVFTFAKILALIIIIIAGAFHLFNGHTENFENAFEGTTREPGYIALAFYSGLFSYAGWNFLNFVTEELKDPFRNLPRAIYISLPLVTVIYVLANVAYFAVLTTDEILSSNAVAVTFGERILGVMSWIMPFSVALSTFGGLNGNIFASARLFFVGAREGHLPSFLSMINLNYFTPTPSLVFLCILSLAYLSTTEVYVLINYTAFVEALFVTLSVAGLVWLRYKKPDLERPIKVPLILPLTFLAVCLFLVTFPFYVSPWETGMGIAITLSGIPVYALTIFWENKPKFYRKAISKFTVLVQKVLLSVPEEKYD